MKIGRAIAGDSIDITPNGPPRKKHQIDSYCHRRVEALIKSREAGAPCSRDYQQDNCRSGAKQKRVCAPCRREITVDQRMQHPLAPASGTIKPGHRVKHTLRRPLRRGGIEDIIECQHCHPRHCENPSGNSPAHHDGMSNINGKYKVLAITPPTIAAMIQICALREALSAPS